MRDPAARTVVHGALLPDATRSTSGKEGTRCQPATEQALGQLLPFNKKVRRPAGRRRTSAGRNLAGAVGTDQRERVLDTTIYPFSAVCELRMFFPVGQYAGTGCFIAPKVVLTAAHNLKSDDLGGLADSVHVYPGLNGDISHPPLPSVVAERKVFSIEWEQGEDDAFDYGVLLLPADTGNEVGWLGVAKYADGDLQGLGVNSASYPSDCPLVSAGNCPPPYTAMYIQHANITRVEPSRFYYTDMLMTKGCSGSPIFVYYPQEVPANQYQILGIHTVMEAVEYHATRISNQCYADIEYWLTLVT